jgi:Mg/Co/Ni transporter MgtE
MLGIVTSADVAGLVQQKAGEDILKIGGMEAMLPSICSGRL